MKKIILICCLPLVVCGCASSLRKPASDHAVVTRVVVESCKAAGVGEGKCTIEDLEAVAMQAECLAAALEGERCSGE
jgi:hypothetical protein